MVGILPIVAGGALLLSKKGGGIGKITKLDTTKGILGDAVTGLGVGTLANVADKKFLGGMVQGFGIGIGQTINGKPLRLNGTDLLTYFVANKGLKFDKKSLVKGAVTVGVKKIGELYDWIDPVPFQINSRIAAANAGMAPTNVSASRLNMVS